MKLLHTSDIQLDAPFAFLGDKGHQYRKQLKETFAEIVDLAQKENYDVLLIAGDLFDSNRPQQTTSDFVVTTLGKLSIPVCILPGNHDCYQSNSIYRKTKFPENVTIFSDKVKQKLFNELDLAVYGNAALRRDSANKPLADIQPTAAAKWHVALAHGNLAIGKIENPERPILPKEIEACGMDYVALGDWHGYYDCSQGDVRAVYCGSPEPTAFDQDQSGFVASVTLEKDSVLVEKVRIGKVQAGKIALDVTGHNQSDILNMLTELKDPNRMIAVDLTGLASIGSVIAPERLESELSECFYAIRIRDRSHPELESISAADYPPENVIGKFIELMRKQIEDAEDEKSCQRAEQALQLGVALLEGKEVI
jgi:DNA repair exonuclease SbcCD nuclease subunit